MVNPIKLAMTIPKKRIQDNDYNRMSSAFCSLNMVPIIILEITSITLSFLDRFPRIRTPTAVGKFEGSYNYSLYIK